MFVQEKGIDIPKVEVDLMAGENRQAEHVQRNPAGQTPCLELDDGSFLSEITAICEYLEDKHPTPALIGSNAEEKGETRMWTRRIDLNICENMARGFRYSEGLPIFEKRITVLPEAGPGMKQIALEQLAWLDGLMQENQWICGDRFTLADIMLFGFIEFSLQLKQPIPADCTKINAWYERTKARDSSAA